MDYKGFEKYTWGLARGILNYYHMAYESECDVLNVVVLTDSENECVLHKVKSAVLKGAKDSTVDSVEKKLKYLLCK